MKKKKILVLGLLITAVAIWGIVKFYSRSAMPAEKAIWVQASTVKESSLPLEARAIGTITARSVEITSEVAGHVEKILFQDGAAVTEGTPLIQLDDSVYLTKYGLAKAKLAYSEINFDRMVQLGKKGAIAKQAIEAAEADLKEKKADAEESKVMVDKMKLTAPFDGIVGKRKVHRGDYVTIGQSVVMITDTKHLHIEYNISEKYLPLLKIGQEVKITAVAYPGKTFTGKVAFISPTITADNRSVSLYASVDNKDNELAPGMFVNVLHSLGTKERVLMIPSRSLVPILDGEQVYKIVDGKAYAVSVLLGQRIEDTVQITQGLAPGDVIITDGQLKVKNGMPVQVKT